MPPTPDPNGKKGVITYQLNGGSYNGSTEDIVETYDVGTVLSVHEAPTRDGYTFSYWKGSKYQPGDKYTVGGDHTFVAQWEESGTSIPSTPASKSDDPSNPGTNTTTPSSTTGTTTSASGVATPSSACWDTAGCCLLVVSLPTAKRGYSPFGCRRTAVG